MDAKLVVVGGKASADEYQLQLPTVLGRSRSASLPVGHPLVSRKHCELYEQDGVLMVRDLGSLNGTFVDDHRLAEDAVVLKPGGRLTVGSVTFQAVYGAVGDPGALADEQIDFANGSSAQLGQIDPTMDAGSPGELPSPDEVEMQSPGNPAHRHTETLPIDDSQAGPSHRDDSFDLNWLEDEADASEGPEDTAEVAIPMAKPARPALPIKHPPAAKPPLPRSAPPAATENETVPVDSTGSSSGSNTGGDDEEDLDDFLNSLK